MCAWLLCCVLLVHRIHADEGIRAAILAGCLSSSPNIPVVPGFYNVITPLQIPPGCTISIRSTAPESDQVVISGMNVTRIFDVLGTLTLVGLRMQDGQASPTGDSPNVGGIVVVAQNAVFQAVNCTFLRSKTGGAPDCRNSGCHLM